MTVNDSNSEYLTPEFQAPYRNNQRGHHTSRSPYGMIRYTRNKVRVLETLKWSDTHFEGLQLYVQHTILPVLVQLIGLHVLCQCEYKVFSELLELLMIDVDKTFKIIIIVNFNMKAITYLVYT